MRRNNKIKTNNKNNWSNKKKRRKRLLRRTMKDMCKLKNPPASVILKWPFDERRAIACLLNTHSLSAYVFLVIHWFFTRNEWSNCD